MRNFAAAFACIVIGTTTHADGQAISKVGYVNSKEIMDNAPGKREADAQFSKAMEEYGTAVQRMNDTLRAMIDAYDKDAPKLDSAARIIRYQAVRERENQYRAHGAELQQKIQGAKLDRAQHLIGSINYVLEQVRAEGHYTVILDAANQSSPIVAADRSADLTSLVIQRLAVLAAAESQQPVDSAIRAAPQH